MKKRRAVIFICAAVLGALVAALLALPKIFACLRRQAEKSAPAEAQPYRYLIEKNPEDVRIILVENGHGSWGLTQEHGEIAIVGKEHGEIPADEMNAEYANLLIAAAANVAYEEEIDGSELAAYSLDKPRATAIMHYAGGSRIALYFGGEEPVTRGVYFIIQSENEADGKVYLMPSERAAWFLMPAEKFINYEIIPFTELSTPLKAFPRLQFGGDAFPDAVVVEAAGQGEDDVRMAASFGAVSHFVWRENLRKKAGDAAVHEIDQGEALAVFGSLQGLLNLEVFDYNCGDAALAAYGFGKPLLTVEGDFILDENEAPQKIAFSVVQGKPIIREDGSAEATYLLLREGSRVVHRIDPSEAFLRTSYEKLAMRWFLTPFITDIAEVELQIDGKRYQFVLSGGTNRELQAAAKVGGEFHQLDIDAFRKFYSLLVSASNDGTLLADTSISGSPLLTLTYRYKDKLKKDDVLKLYEEAGGRRLKAQVNGLVEFAMLRRYAQTVGTAAAALVAGKDFSAEW